MSSVPWPLPAPPVMTPAAGVCAPFQIRLEVRIEATLSLSP